MALNTISTLRRLHATEDRKLFREPRRPDEDRTKNLVTTSRDIHVINTRLDSVHQTLGEHGEKLDRIDKKTANFTAS